MRLIKPDPDRRITLPGVVRPVPRPVDIDAARAGFSMLRTLRIYRFAAGTRIDGHAEEDEVYIVVMAGAIGLAIGTREGKEIQCQLSAPGESPDAVACAAYLPAHGHYELTARDDADVAYVRATPHGSRPAASFQADAAAAARRASPVILDPGSHAERLRLRMFHLPATMAPAAGTDLYGADAFPDGALLHVRAQGNGGRLALRANGQREVIGDWDTIAVGAGERAALERGPGVNALALLVWAL